MTRRNLTPKDREEIFSELLALSSSLNLSHGNKIVEYSHLAAKYGCSTSTITRLWRRGIASVKNGNLSGIYSKRAGRCGRKTRLTPERRQAISQEIELIPLERRGDIRTLAESLSIPKSTLHDYFKRGLFERQTCRVKPALSVENRVERLKFALSFVQSDMTFQSMHDYVHVDEKWFFIKKTSQRYYLSRTEPDPYSSVQSKRHIQKIMMLVAVARPRYDPSGVMLFDGKTGAWSFVKMVPAKRASKNRPAGALEMKSVKVNLSVYRSFLIDKVIPRIKEVWPSGRKVIIQQDNAGPHVKITNAAVVKAGTADGWDIRMRCQPPNSPDMNVLDLGFFSSLQSLQFKKRSRSIQQLVNHVEQAFTELEPRKLNKVFLTLQAVLNAAMCVGGGNGFRIPHMGNNSIERTFGRLPDSIECDPEAVERAQVSVRLQASLESAVITLL